MQPPLALPPAAPPCHTPALPPLPSPIGPTPAPFGVPKVPQRPDAAPEPPPLPLPRPSSHRQSPSLPLPTSPIPLPLAAERRLCTRYSGPSGPQRTCPRSSRPLAALRCDSPVPQPTTPRYQPPTPPISLASPPPHSPLLRADASASSRCQWLHGPTCTPLGPPRPLTALRCGSPVPQPTTPRYQPPIPQILRMCLRHRRSPPLQQKRSHERTEQLPGMLLVSAPPPLTPLTHPPPMVRFSARQPVLQHPQRSQMHMCLRHRRGRVLQEKHHQQRNKANCGKPFASAPPLLTPPTHPPPISRLLTPESALQHLTHIQVHLTRSLR